MDLSERYSGQMLTAAYVWAPALMFPISEAPGFQILSLQNRSNGFTGAPLTRLYPTPADSLQTLCHNPPAPQTLESP